MALQIQSSGVSGTFPLASTTTTSTANFLYMGDVGLGYEVTVSYAITPEEVYAGPPGSAPPKKDEES